MYRKQTLYLLATTILCGLLLLLPLVTIEPVIIDGAATLSSASTAAEYNVWGIAFGDGQTEPFLYHGILTLLATLLPIAIIYLHKRRELQLRLCIVEGLFVLGLIGFEAMGIYRLGAIINEADFILNYSPVLLSPVIALLTVVLAYRGVAADIWLLKDSDRIR